MNQYVIAVVGHPNVGKSTWINALANTHLKVGNYPGITVDLMKAVCKSGKDELQFLDLPGLYSIQDARNEEKVTVNFLNQRKMDAIIQVVDGNQFSLHMGLYEELKKFKVPVLILVNFMEEEAGKELMKKDSSILCGGLNNPIFHKYCIAKVHEACIKKARLPLHLTNIPISNQRKKELLQTSKLDQILLHPYIGRFIFLCVISIIFLIIFYFSTPLIDFFDYMIQDVFGSFVLSSVSSFWQCFLKQVVFQGIGSVLSFTPLIFCFYFFFSALEESGYMARVAYLMDRFMRVFHLSGKAFVAFLFGFGCNVPAIYATRTLSSERERKRCCLLIPFLSCSARLPVYMLFASIFFMDHIALTIISIYGIGIIVVFVLSILFYSSNIQDSMEILELPILRFPKIKHMIIRAYEEALQYIRKAIFVVGFAMLVLWSCMMLPSGNIQTSYLKQGVQIIQPVFQPLGFGESWELVASIPVSIIAKESVIGFLSQVMLEEPGTKISMLFSSNEKLKIFSYLLFISLTIPCIMTLNAQKRLFGTKIMFLSMILGFLIPYITCFSIYQIISMFL